MTKRIIIKVGLITLLLLCGICGIAPYLRDLSLAVVDERQATADFLGLEELPNCAENLIYYYDTNAGVFDSFFAFRGATRSYYTLIMFDATEECFDRFAILLDAYVNSEDLDMFYRSTTSFAENAERDNFSPLPQDFPTIASYDPNKSVVNYISRKRQQQTDTHLSIYYDKSEQRVWMYEDRRVWSGGGE